MRKSVILVLCMSLFFSVSFAEKVQSSCIEAPKAEIIKKLDPMDKVLEGAKRAEEESVERQKNSRSETSAKDGSDIEGQSSASSIENSYRLKLEDGAFVVEVNPEKTDSRDKAEKIILGEEVNFSEDINKSKKVGKSFEVKKQGSEIYSDMLSGSPMEDMVPAISKKNKEVASFLIAIAKKESDWGKHSPSKDGRDCFNYWGYRGTYNQTDSGYSCFDNPEQAVETVGGRIQELIDRDINTPERMIIWKCGSSCAGHDPHSVKKWIADISLYYKKLNS